MNKTTVIALVGPAGSGKSTVANYLVEKYGAVRFGLATPLKEVAKRTLGFTDQQLYGTQAQKETVDPRYGFSCRTFLQKLGTEGCRTVFGESFWTKMCLDIIVQKAPRIAVIEDARFINECAAVLDDERFDGFVIRLHPVKDDESLVRSIMASDHASEQEWRDCDASIEIHPGARGIPELLRYVDDAMRLLWHPMGEAPQHAKVLDDIVDSFFDASDISDGIPHHDPAFDDTIISSNTDREPTLPFTRITK